MPLQQAFTDDSEHESPNQLNLFTS
jgi:hypothetical protein